MPKGESGAAARDIKKQITSDQAVASGIRPGLQAGLSEFAGTGGVSPEEAALTREQTSSGISSLYDQLKQHLQNRSRIQGGYSPGSGAQEARLGRQSAQDVASGITGANLGLLQQKRQGRLAGLGGLQDLLSQYLGQVPGLLGERAKFSQRPGWASDLLTGLEAAGVAK